MKYESQIQAEITKRYEAEGWYVVKLIQTSVNGIPDLLCVKGGRCLFIEVKRKGSRPRPLQKYRHKELRAHGCEVLVLTE